MDNWPIFSLSQKKNIYITYNIEKKGQLGYNIYVCILHLLKNERCYSILKFVIEQEQDKTLLLLQRERFIHCFARTFFCKILGPI